MREKIKREVPKICKITEPFATLSVKRRAKRVKSLQQTEIFSAIFALAEVFGITFAVDKA